MHFTSLLNSLVHQEYVASVFSEKTISFFLDQLKYLEENKTDSTTYRMKSQINSTCIMQDDLIIKGSLITGDNVRIGKNVRLEGNIILSSNVVVNDDCFIRGDVFLGRNVRVGRLVEIKDCFIGNSCSIGPLSFLGDSMLGDDVYLGALVRTSNERLDRGNIKLHLGEKKIDVGPKFGCIIGNEAKIGLQSSIMPGRVIPMRAILPPLTVFKSLRQIPSHD